ncbi:hypothetical protein [Roseovarius spongiae]|uniref:hypothetical protein n=1 Tax=Roseovarius spongiae TaxID=2320272 RepID=UPI0011C35951|nr:hypothetical protein [Roseovarius spongiae]
MPAIFDLLSGLPGKLLLIGSVVSAILTLLLNFTIPALGLQFLAISVIISLVTSACGAFLWVLAELGRPWIRVVFGVVAVIVVVVCVWQLVEASGAEPGEGLEGRLYLILGFFFLGFGVVVEGGGLLVSGSPRPN